MNNKKPLIVRIIFIVIAVVMVIGVVVSACSAF